MFLLMTNILVYNMKSCFSCLWQCLPPLFHRSTSTLMIQWLASLSQLNSWWAFRSSSVFKAWVDRIIAAVCACRLLLANIARNNMLMCLNSRLEGIFHVINSIYMYVHFISLLSLVLFLFLCFSFPTSIYGLNSSIYVNISLLWHIFQ